MTGMISSERLLRLMAATPEQLGLIDEILAGRLPAAPEASRVATPEVEPYIDKREVARRLGVQLRTVDSYMARGRIPFYRMSGRAIRMKWSEIERHVQAVARVAARGEAGI